MINTTVNKAVDINNTKLLPDKKQAYLRTGEYFIQNGNIDKNQLDLALNIQKVTKERIGRILINLGLISKDELTKYLSKYNPDALIEERILSLLTSKKIDRSLLLKTKTVIVSENDEVVFISTLTPSVKETLEKALHKKVKIIPFALEKLYIELKKIKRDRGKAEFDISNPNEILDFLIKDAISKNASDIHIEPVANFLSVRYRLDGVLHPIHTFPLPVAEPLIARIKGLGNMDIAEKKLPQDGSFSCGITPAQSIYIRLSTIFSEYGEVVTMRLLDKDKVLLKLEGLGINKLDNWKNVIRSQAGIILVVGPTGSGKTTTLYTTMLQLDRIGKNIITIEDPVEYHFPFIRQVQVNRVLGLDFARFLKHSLRQDPDVILVGEIRDRETALTAVRAAETGHLVFATVHSNNIPATFTRLYDLGVSKASLKYLLRCILAQQLVRKVCLSCSGKGCELCGNIGYNGRMLISEIQVFNENSIEPWLSGKHPEYRTLFDDAIDIYRSGLTDKKEIERVFGKCLA